MQYGVLNFFIFKWMDERKKSPHLNLLMKLKWGGEEDVKRE
jgi:hypothetical protein